MEFEFVEYSCVIVAQSHNPTILNKDWAKNNQLVNVNDVGDIQQPEIVTPAHSELNYASGLKITLEEPRFLVGCPSSFTAAVTTVSDVASKYVTLLPHIPFSAVGNNFKMVCEVKGAKTLLMDKLSRKSRFHDELDSITFKYTFKEKDGCVRNVTLSGASKKQRDQNGEIKINDVILLDANFHREISPEYPVDDAVDSYMNDTTEILELSRKFADVLNENE